MGTIYSFLVCVPLIYFYYLIALVRPLYIVLKRVKIVEILSCLVPDLNGLRSGFSPLKTISGMAFLFLAMLPGPLLFLHLYEGILDFVKL